MPHLQANCHGPDRPRLPDEGRVAFALATNCGEMQRVETSLYAHCYTELVVSIDKTHLGVLRAPRHCVAQPELNAYFCVGDQVRRGRVERDVAPVRADRTIPEFACARRLLTLTRTVVPAMRSRTNMSVTPFVSWATRSDASE